MKYPWFFCRRENMWLDSWTYGDWQQFICKRGDTTQCAKLSFIPSIIMGIGFTTFMLVFFMMVAAFSSERMVVFLIGLAMFVGPFIAWQAGWRLMKAVGPLNIEGKRVLASDA